ncbi:lactonohydrolase [Xylariaceae sp. FL1272]|nr:lactonohydrolase [Xylariaceae sp. FL1272]
MVLVAVALAVISAGTAVATGVNSIPRTEIPAQAQFINQRAFNVIPDVPPPSVFNGTTPFTPPGYDLSALLEKPFLVYNEEFYDVIGHNPSLTLIAHSDTDPIFHEAVVWYPPTNEVFFVQNAGAPAAGTGLNKSSIIQKISLEEAESVTALRNATGKIQVHVVDSDPMVINPNGGINYKGQLLFAAEGQGANRPSELIVMTDPLYGYLQDFRPEPVLPAQVYRYNDKTGAVTVVADGFTLPNGTAHSMVFSPDGCHVYIADSGANHVFWGYNGSLPASIYRYDVTEDGTFENRKLFAYVDSGIPDGVHVDTEGRLYAGCGDGVHVWNTSGTLIGKIFIGEVSANFNFAGDGGMVICAETDLFYAKLQVTGGHYSGSE